MNYREELQQISKIAIATLALIFLLLIAFTTITLQIPLGNLHSFVVTSSNMQPTIPVGSVIYSWKQDAYGEGDIVAFNKGEEPFIRRIDSFTRRNENNFYFTKADANTAVDSNTLLFRNILGKEFFYIPLLGTLLTSVLSISGFITLFLLAGIVFICYKIVKLKNEFKREIERRIMRKLRMNM